MTSETEHLTNAVAALDDKTDAAPSYAFSIDFKRAVIVFTGLSGLRTIEELKAEAETLGAQVSGSVSRSTTLVVYGPFPGSKLDKAHELHIPTISLAEYEQKVLEATRLDDKTAARIPEPTPFLPKRVRHRKSGGNYKVLGVGRMQTERWSDNARASERQRFGPSVDMDEVVLYRSEADGSYWARPRSEFMDGRFEALRPDRTPCPTPAEFGIFHHDGVWYLPIDPKLAEAINQPEVNLTEEQFFMIEAAEQIAGIETIDDDARTYVVTREQIVTLMTSVRDTTKEQQRQYLTSVDLDDFIDVSIANMRLGAFNSAAIRTLAREAAALATRERIEPFNVNEFIDDEVATLLARMKDMPTPADMYVLIETEVGEIAREAVLRVIFDKATLLDNLARHCHAASASAGWWTDLQSGETLVGKRNKGELLMLMVSEAAEIMEAVRKDLPSDKLPGFSGEEEEAADLFLRLGDYAGAHKLRLGAAVVAKMNYNATREDHKIENRHKANGKKF